MTTCSLMATILGDAELAYNVCEFLENRVSVPTIDELTKLRGVGYTTATKILACMELSATYMVGSYANVYKEPSGIARRFCSLKYAEQEHLYVLTLDASNHEIGCHEVSKGIATQTQFHPREVLRYALLDNAVSIALVHNHPSGSNEPSDQDYGITRVMCAAAKIMQIHVIDHVVISRSGYTSICRQQPEIFEVTM